MSTLKKIFSSFLLILLISSHNYVKAQTSTDDALSQLANEMFEFGDYEGALELYLQALSMNVNNERANFMAGRCYLRTTHGKSTSVTYFHKAFELNPDISNKIFFYIAEGYRFGYDFDKAIEHYERYLEMLENDARCCPGEDVFSLIKKTKKRVEECKNARKYVNAPGTAVITNLGDKINSEFDDYAPTLSLDGQTLIFTSRREGSTGNLKDVDHKYYEDIYISHLEDGQWTTPKGMGEKINTIYHESNIGLANNGKRLYIYTIKNNGDIYVSELKDGEWKKPKSFKKINTKYQETSVFETEDSQKLFFSSNKPGGSGGLDIYVCEKKGSNWGDPKPLSVTINTEYDEEGAVFDIHSNTLYFSSKGHNGMGGYDLFKSKYNSVEDTWSEPENLGYPVNSSDDDLFFILSPDGESGYYASFKEDSYGGIDIYGIKFIDEADLAELNKKQKSPDSTNLQTQDNVNLNFQVFDEETSKPINAEISFLNSSTGKILEGLTFTGGKVQKTFTAQMKGDYVVTIKPIGDKASTHLVETINLTISPSVNEQNIEKKIYIKKNKKLDQGDSNSLEVSNKNIIRQKNQGDSGKKQKKYYPVTLKLNVVDSESKESLNARVQIMKKGSDQILFESMIQQGDFSYTFKELKETEYIVIIASHNHIFRTLELRIDPALKQKKLIKKRIELRRPMKPDGTSYQAQSFRNVYFGFNLYTLKSVSYVELNKLRDMLQESATMKVQILGHTDDIGTHEYNINLSLKRASAVKKYLVKQGIEANRIKVKGYGETRPMATNHDEKEGRELNRRTEFIILHE